MQAIIIVFVVVEVAVVVGYAFGIVPSCCCCFRIEFCASIFSFGRRYILLIGI